MFTLKTRIRWAAALAFFFVGLAVAMPTPAQEKGESKEEPKKTDKDEVAVIDLLAGDEQVALEGKSKKLVFKTVAGAVRIDCSKLEVDEIEFGTIAGGATVVLKLADKAKLKKLSISNASGGATIDASQLDVADIEIGMVAGSAKLDLQATGKIAFKNIGGGPSITILRCKDLVVDELVGGPKIDASYSGEARVPQIDGDAVTLRKIEAPKK